VSFTTGTQREEKEAMKFRNHFWRLLFLLVLSGVMSGCTALQNVREQLNQPVRVQEPTTGQKLGRGQPFDMRASLDVDYVVASIEVQLWNVTTGAEHTWNVAVPAGGPPLRVSEVLIVPEALPLGADYRLQITALPAAPTDGALGYSTPV
jgi:hypothetical protein